MDTINISLPSQLKSQADTLISHGHFASFSDLVRTALRRIISDNQYDLWAEEAIEEYRKGKSTVLRSKKDIHEYVERMFKQAKKK